MINVLLEGYGIDAPWLYEELKYYVSPSHKVTVIALGFRPERIRTLSDWNTLYGKNSGKDYRGIVRGFAAYGIKESNISFINYFSDNAEDAKKKIAEADILLFTGGLPDIMTDRINELGLLPHIMRHNGIVMGYSAGALIQLKEYHLSPDKDYPIFKYYNGLPFLSDFYLEVHYEGTEAQKKAITRVLTERKKTVYATALMSGAIIFDNGSVKTLGDVREFEP